MKSGETFPQPSTGSIGLLNSADTELMWTSSSSSSLMLQHLRQKGNQAMMYGHSGICFHALVEAHVELHSIVLLQPQ